MNEIIKLSFRAIKKSFGRFIAVFAIIALGVGFFSGLRITQRAMLITGNDYITDLSMYDLRLISTYGFTEDEVNSLKKTKGIDRAVGSYDIDALVKNGSASDIVIHFASLSDRINKLSVVSGRLPKNDSEIVLDSRYYSQSDIGRKIVLSDDNSDDVFESLLNGTFTIVGTVSSPEYLNYTRGSSKIGTGKISAFAYITPDAFTSEYYTSCYLKLDNNSFIYSDEYNALIDKSKNTLISDAESLLNDRYLNIISEYTEKIELAEKEYNEGKDRYDSIEGIVSLLRRVSDLPFIGGVISTDDMYSIVERLRSLNLITPENADMLIGMIDQIYLIDPDGMISIDDIISYAEKALSESKIKLEEAEKQILEGKEKIASIEKPEIYALTRNENAGYVSFKNDTSIVEGISSVFPIFFFLVAALVCNTTMSRMVYEDRGQIGTLKAIGYSKSAIRSIYIIYSGIASVTGCFSGYMLGIYFIPKAIWGVYDIMYGFTDIEFLFSPLLLLISLIVSLICSVGVAVVSVSKIINLQPSELIRPKADSKGKKSVIEGLSIFSKLGFTSKISVRNTLRYKSRFFMMILGIAGCTALLLTGFGIKDSIYDIADEQFGNIITYDYYISLRDPIEKNDLSDVLKNLPDEVDSAAGVCDISLALQGEDNLATVYLNCFSEDDISSFINLKNGKRKIELPGRDKAVITSGLADKFGLEKGDTVKGIDSSMREYSFTVSDVCDNHVFDYIFVSVDSLEEITGDNLTFNKLCVTAKKGTDLDKLAKVLMSDGNVISVQINENVRRNISDMLSSLNLIVLLLTVCAAALAFIVIYNLTNLNIIERSRELATLKVIGFSDIETYTYIFRESIIQSIIGIFCGLPFGFLLNAFVVEKINIDIVNFYAKITLQSCLISFALTFLFAILTNALLVKKVKGVSMTDSLKSVE